MRYGNDARALTYWAMTMVTPDKKLMAMYSRRWQQLIDATPRGVTGAIENQLTPVDAVFDEPHQNRARAVPLFDRTGCGRQTTTYNYFGGEPEIPTLARRA